ncbi:hypothetical protein [Streptomyces sp. UG1]|uniref:hypothetical protein n=1 Tax=Streptomyces sp. UG1 TaxID=3417652 RepID=UPI003CF1A01C
MNPPEPPAADRSGHRTAPEPESWTTLRARLAALTRHGRAADDPEVLEVQRELRAAKLEERIRREVEAAPPLNPDQIERLRALLPPVPARDPGTAP